MLSHGLVNAAGNGLRILGALVSVPILVRSLGLEAFGALILLQAIINIAALSESGLSTSATLHLSPWRRDPTGSPARHLLAFILCLAFAASSAAAIVVILASPLLGRLFSSVRTEMDSRTLFLALSFAGLTVVFRALLQVLVGVLHAFQRFPAATLIQSGHFLLVQAVLVALAAIGANLAQLAGGMAAVGLAAMLLTAFLVRDTLPVPIPPLRLPAEQRRALTGSSRVIAVTHLANALFNQADKLVVSAVLGPLALGMYGTFTTMTAQVNTLSAAACQPVLALLAGQRNCPREVVASAFGFAFRICALTVATLCTSLILLLNPLMRLLFPDIPVDAYPALVVLIVAYGVFALNAPAYFVLQATGQARFVRNIALVSAGLTLLGIAVLGQFAGLIGAAAGCFLFSTMFALTIRAYRRFRYPRLARALWQAVPSLSMIAVSVLAWCVTPSHGVVALLFAAAWTVFAVDGRHLYRLHRSTQHLSFPP